MNGNSYYTNGLDAAFLRIIVLFLWNLRIAKLWAKFYENSASCAWKSTFHDSSEKLIQQVIHNKKQVCGCVNGVNPFFNNVIMVTIVAAATCQE